MEKNTFCFRKKNPTLDMPGMGDGRIQSSIVRIPPAERRVFVLKNSCRRQLMTHLPRLRHAAILCDTARVYQAAREKRETVSETASTYRYKAQDGDSQSNAVPTVSLCSKNRKFEMATFNAAHHESGGVVLFNGELILLFCDNVNVNLPQTSQHVSTIVLHG